MAGPVVEQRQELVAGFGHQRHIDRIDADVAKALQLVGIVRRPAKAPRQGCGVARGLQSVPSSSSPAWFQPPPRPNRNRPADTWSIVATSLAVWIVSRWITRAMPVATLSFLVAQAAAVSVTNGSITS